MHALLATGEDGMFSVEHSLTRHLTALSDEAPLHDATVPVQTSSVDAPLLATVTN